jgi:hypothetical protein
MGRLHDERAAGSQHAAELAQDADVLVPLEVAEQLNRLKTASKLASSNGSSR